MEYQKATKFAISLILLLIIPYAAVSLTVDCTTVLTLLSSCSTFISYGSPDPIPGTACCDSLVSLNLAGSDSIDNRRIICRCFMTLVSPYNPNATTIATLPGFCGVSLGFVLDPNTDCNYIT